MSPAYDLLNSHIHISDQDFTLDEGLLPKKMVQGKIKYQFSVLAHEAGIPEKVFRDAVSLMLSGADEVERLVAASFLDAATQRNYLQAYQRRVKQFEQ
jgi:serine/threonine-protein kinase HipA